MSKRTSLVIKRAFDIVVSLNALVLFSPLLCFIGLAIKFDSPGSVFFRQDRVGQHGSVFRIWKFRTMVVGAETMGDGLNVVENDPRMTRVGQLLRRYSLDELPQLINILKGEMSLVGPRPALPIHLEFYDSFQIRRLEVKPGLTGLAQVNGRATLSWPERIKFDVHYIDHHSLFFDLFILLKTISVLGSRGIYNRYGGGWNFRTTRQVSEDEDNAKPTK